MGRKWQKTYFHLLEIQQKKESKNKLICYGVYSTFYGRAFIHVHQFMHVVIRKYAVANEM